MDTENTNDDKAMPPASAGDAPQNNRHNCTPADWCRLNDCGAGTILEGDDGNGPERIVITAIGYERVLAKSLSFSFLGERSCVLPGGWKKVGQQDPCGGDDMTNTSETAEPSGASSGYAGEWEPKAGDTVRVKDPDQFVSPLDKQLKDRDGVVLRVWKFLGHGRCRAAVRFGKRNGRGKEFEHSLSVVDLMPWPKKDA